MIYSYQNTLAISLEEPHNLLVECLVLEGSNRISIRQLELIELSPICERTELKSAKETVVATITRRLLELSRDVELLHKLKAQLQ